MSEINLDRELNDKFEKIFGQTAEKGEASESMLAKRIRENKVNRFVDNTMANWGEPGVVPSKPSDNTPISFRPRAELLDIHEDGLGRHFSIIESSDVSTIVFRVLELPDRETGTKRLSADRLERASEPAADGTTKRTFYVEPPTEEVSLVILSFNRAEGQVFVNGGMLIDNEVRVKRRPLLVELSKPGEGLLSNLNTSTHKLADGEDPKSESTRQFEADLDSRTVIIDTETLDTVKREVFFDREKNEWKARASLVPYRSYFNFQIYDDEEVEMTPLEKGLYYRYGMGGFPVDSTQAVSGFEQDNSPAAWFRIAEFILSGVEFSDEQLGLEYLKQAAEAGCDAAKVCLALYYYFNSTEQTMVSSLVSEAIRDGFAPADYIAGYAYETGTLVDRNVEEAFEHYLAAAKRKYGPALRRLAVEGQGEIKDTDIARQFFVEHFDSDRSYADYCFGTALVGQTRLSVKPTDPISIKSEDWIGLFATRGAEMIVRAAESGCAYAYRDALEILSHSEYGVRFEIDRDSELFLRNDVDAARHSVFLSDHLLARDGADDGYEFDSFVFSLLKFHADNGTSNAGVFLTLSQMLANGRGCETNYVSAASCYRRAIGLGNSDAYYHLGKLYEDGFLNPESGMSATEYALMVYKEGAAAGNNLCKKELEKAEKDESDQNKVNSEDAPNLAGMIDILSTKVTDLQQSVATVDSHIGSLSKDIGDTKDTTELIFDSVCDSSQLIKDTNETVHRIEGRLSEYFDEITKLKLELSSVREQCGEDSEKYAEQMSKLFQAVTEGSIQSANNQKEVYLIEESSLRNRFGSNWNKLMEESQSSLISARVIFKLLDQIPQETALDYSGPCISATSALERELKRIFQDNYSGFSGKYDFTLGDFPTILECYKNQAGKWTPEDQISSVLRDYLCSIIKKRYIANKSDPRTCFLSKKLPDGSVLDFSFIDTIDFVRRRYRNPAAHTDRLSKKTAEQCFTRIMGPLDAETRLTMTESALWFLMEVIN